MKGTGAPHAEWDHEFVTEAEPMKCPNCRGKGTVALHGIAIPAEEFNDWHPDEQEMYLNGDYDTVCETCNGSGTVTEEELEYQALVESERRYFQ